MNRDLSLVLFGVFMGMAINVAIHHLFPPYDARTVAHQTLPETNK